MPVQSFPEQVFAMSDPRPLHVSRAPLTASPPDPVADAFRRWGYLSTDLDPMGRMERFEHPDITDARALGNPQDVERLYAIYCGPHRIRVHAHGGT